MKPTTLTAATLLALSLSAVALAGGNKAYAPAAKATPAAESRDIVDTAVASKDHTTLVAAVKAAGLVDTLKGPGPFTVFAPTDAAFGKLPAGTVETLVKPENKATLTGILTYHVVAGRLDAKTLLKQVQDGGGRATLTTVKGDSLVATVKDGKLVLTDAKGGASTVTVADLSQRNGVIHVDSVLLP